MKTREKGTTLCPNYASLKLWCDADFCGNRDPGSAHVERPTEKLRKGFVVMFAGCPLKWLSKTALSTIEAEFIVLSEGLHTAIPIMNLVDELRVKNVGMPIHGNKVMCKVLKKTQAIE